MPFKSQVDRLALLATLGLIVLNLLTTGRWAAVPGAPRGWRWPYLVVAIVLTSVATIRPTPAVWRWPPWVSRVLLWGGLSMLAGLGNHLVVKPALRELLFEVVERGLST